LGFGVEGFRAGGRGPGAGDWGLRVLGFGVWGFGFGVRVRVWGLRFTVDG